MNQLAFKLKLSDVVDEYEKKELALKDSLESFEEAGNKIRMASTVFGTFGNVSLDTGRIHAHDLKNSLIKSAWRHVYNGMNIAKIATAKDKKRLDQILENPPSFTIENMREVFGDYILDPWANILRGVAEVFCDLDPAYKSHDKVKVGVKGLPKRIIINSVNSHGYGWGWDKIKDVLNALAAYQQKALVQHSEINALSKDGNVMLKAWEERGFRDREKIHRYPARGITLKRFKNGNAHMHFEPETLKDINRALAKYYGDVLPDCHEDKPEKRGESTAVSKDLQYYPTPQEVVERVLEGIYGSMEGIKVLEPSCGCGRIMDAVKKRGANVFGIEFDPDRANECRKKGHNVLTANFLETIPDPSYDRVIMNPPFYGRHYFKHVNQALKFLKPGGTLTTILPVTARYDHFLLEGKWQDLPVGAFRESGTNINTTILTMRA